MPLPTRPILVIITKGSARYKIYIKKSALPIKGKAFLENLSIEAIRKVKDECFLYLSFMECNFKNAKLKFHSVNFELKIEFTDVLSPLVASVQVH